MRLVLDEASRQRRTCCRPPWRPAGSPSSSSTVAVCPRSSGRRWREVRPLPGPVARRWLAHPGGAPHRDGAGPRHEVRDARPAPRWRPLDRRRRPRGGPRDHTSASGAGSSGSGRCSSWLSWPPPSSSRAHPSAPPAPEQVGVVGGVSGRRAVDRGRRPPRAPAPPSRFVTEPDARRGPGRAARRHGSTSPSSTAGEIAGQPGHLARATPRHGRSSCARRRRRSGAPRPTGAAGLTPAQVASARSAPGRSRSTASQPELEVDDREPDVGDRADPDLRDAHPVQHLDPHRASWRRSPAGSSRCCWRRSVPIQLLGGKVLGIGAGGPGQAALIVAVRARGRRGGGLRPAARHRAAGGGEHAGVAGARLRLLLLGLRRRRLHGRAPGPGADPRPPARASRSSSATSSRSPRPAPATRRPSVKVLAYLPPTAPFAMPVLVGLSAVTWWQFMPPQPPSASSARLASPGLATSVYRRAILRTGGRVKLREVLAPTA